MTISSISNQFELTTISYLTDNREQREPFLILDLPRDLGEYLKRFLTGKEIAALNTTCTTLNHNSSLAEHRIKEDLCVWRLIKKVPPFTISLIKLKAKMGDFKGAFKLTEDLCWTDLHTAYHELAKTPTRYGYLRDIIEKLNDKERVVHQASVSLLDYKLNPDPEKFGRTKAFIQMCIPPYTFQLERQLLSEQAKQSYKGEDLKIRLKQLFEEHLKELDQRGLPSKSSYIDIYSIEALIEIGEGKTALELIQKFKKIVKNGSFKCVGELNAIALRKKFLLLAASLEAKISFKKALKTVKEIYSNSWYNSWYHIYYYLLLDLFIASTFQEIPLDDLKILKEFLCSKENIKSEALAVWAQIVQGEIPDVETISKNISDIDLHIITLVCCARVLGKKAMNIAMKYLQAAMDIVSKKMNPQYPEDDIKRATNILAFSRKIVS